MPVEQIDLGKGSYVNVDEISTRSGVSPAIWNGYLDDLGANVKLWGRNSIWAVRTELNQVDGLFYSTTLGKTIIVSGGNVYAYDFSTVPTTQTSPLPTTTILNATLIGTGLEIGKKVCFAEAPALTQSGAYSPFVFMCNGGYIYYTDGTTVTKLDTTITANAPSKCNFVIFADYQLVAQYDERFFVHSEPLDLLNFGDSTNIIAADSSPDDIVGAAYLNRELVIFGKRSIDTFYYSSIGSSATWLKTPGGFQDTGCSSFGTIMVIENSIYFLNHRREFCRYAGRQIEVISTSLTRELQGLSDVSKALAYRVDYNGKHFYWVALPAVGKTYAYDLVLNAWCFMGDWNAEQGKYGIHHGRAFTYDDANNYHLVGGPAGEVTAMSNDDEDSWALTTIPNRFQRTTGYINHGTDLLHKRCNRVTFRVKSGVEFSSAFTENRASIPEYAFMVRFRDEAGPWSNWLYPSLKPIGNKDFTAELRPMGMYRARQWEIAQSDACPFVLVSMEEDFDILR